MCPNCATNQMGLGAGYFYALLICGVFLLVGLSWIVWGFKSGQFKNIESAKYTMLEQDEAPEKTNQKKP